MICIFNFSCLFTFIYFICLSTAATESPAERCRPTFSKSLTVSVAVSKLSSTDFIFHQATSERWWQILPWSSAEEADAASHASHCRQHICVPATCTLCLWNSPAPRVGNIRFNISISVAAKLSGPKAVDYCIWRLMQVGVYKTPLRDTSDLKQRLIDKVGKHVIDEAVRLWRQRLCACVKAKEHHFEHLWVIWVAAV